MANSVETALRKGEERSKFIDGIATVLLTLRSNVAKGRIVIIVEGPDDVQLYRRMYDSDKVIVYAANNCRHIFEILNNLGIMPVCKKQIVVFIVIFSVDMIEISILNSNKMITITFSI